MNASAWPAKNGGWLVEISDRGLPLFTRVVKTRRAAYGLAHEHGATLRVYWLP